MAALEPHCVFALESSSSNIGGISIRSEQRFLYGHNVAGSSLIASLAQSGQTLSHYHAVIKETEVSANFTALGHIHTSYRCPQRGRRKQSIPSFTSHFPLWPTGSAVFVFALEVFGGGGGAAKTASINIFIQPLLSTTNGVSAQFLLSALIIIIIIIMYLRGQQIAVFPRGTFLEVMDCHMVSFERRKKKT